MFFKFFKKLFKNREKSRGRLEEWIRMFFYRKRGKSLKQTFFVILLNQGHRNIKLKTKNIKKSKY